MAAESVGLAASVAGLVSLGLQITGGIFKYTDAFESRQEDLDFVRQQNEALRTTLQAIEQSVAAHGPFPELDTTLSGSMQLFKEELEKIEHLHAELVDSGGKSWTSRMDDRRKRLTYPFNRSKIKELGQRLQKAGGTLQLTLKALDLRISRQHTELLTAMEFSLRGLSSETQLIRSGLAAVEAPIVDIREQLSTTHGAISASTQLLASQYGAILYQAQEHNQVFLGKFQETSNLVQRLTELCSKQQQETIKTIERLVGQTRHNHHPDDTPVSIVRKLAGKPALLKEVSDAIQPFEQAQDQVAAPNLTKKPSWNRSRITASVRAPQSQSILGRTCICPRQRTVRERKRVQLGDSSFFGDWETQTHWHACPLSRMSSKKRRVAVGFNYTGLAHILKTAINVSFSLAYGAGGFSISPSFACIPTVDDKLDPAFRIIGLIGEGFRNLNNGREHLMFACMKRLIRLFDDGKVCATAVNGYNQSLMHHAIFGLASAEFSKSVHGFDATGFFVELVQTLLSYGVAPFTYDTRGLSPMLQIDPWMFDSELVHPVLDILLQANLDSQPVALNDSTIIDGDIYISNPASNVNFIYDICPGFAEACECGPLSMAVIQNDAVAVSRILNSNPGATNETNIYGQSTLHLAATSPWILYTLLKAGNRSLLDFRDASGFTALEIAMVYSSDFCINEKGIQRCYDDECDCCQCIDLLLAAGCSARMHKLVESYRPDAPELQSILSSASELARRKYVFHMKRSRMAIQPPHQRGIFYAPGSRVGDDMSWIFNEITDPHLGALFYRHGFQPHPSCLIHLRPDDANERDTMNFAYLQWLMSHGVDILCRSPKGPDILEKLPNHGLFGAHFAFHFIERDFTSQQRHHLLAQQSNCSWDTSMELTAAIFRRDLTDGCQCHCTVDGCTPFTWMMKGNWFMRDSPGRTPESPSRYAGFFKSHYSECGPELTALTFKAAIRYATFTALNISHTCCGAWDLTYNGHERVQRDPNDIQNINEKQATVLEKLEDLVLQFEEKAVDYLGTDCGDIQFSFHEFWSTCWEVRMNEELDKLHDKEVKEAEERGAQGNDIHSWRPQREVKEENPYDKKTDLRYWMHELDKICPEYSEPWPEESCRVSEVP